MKPIIKFWFEHARQHDISFYMSPEQFSQHLLSKNLIKTYQGGTLCKILNQAAFNEELKKLSELSPLGFLWLSLRSGAKRWMK